MAATWRARSEVAGCGAREQGRGEEAGRAGLCGWAESEAADH